MRLFMCDVMEMMKMLEVTKVVISVFYGTVSTVFIGTVIYLLSEFFKKR